MEKKPTHRIEKLNSLVAERVGNIIKPYLEEEDGLTTVARAEVSKDTKWVKIWLSIVGGNDQDILKTLNKNIYDIQGELNRSLTIKMVPRIQFYIDTSARYAAHISELIDNLHNQE
jgi:ribosome-binding factor A